MYKNTIILLFTAFMLLGSLPAIGADIQLSGKLIASQGLIVKSEVPGRVNKVFFHSGDVIKKGEPLVALNSSILIAEKKQLESNLSLCRVDFYRKKNLFQKNSISKSELDIATAHLKSAIAKIEEINARISQTIVVAPFSGKLGLKKISVGDFVSAGTDIVNLESTNSMFVEFDVPVKFENQIKNNQFVKIKTLSSPDKLFIAKIDSIDSLVNPTTQILTARAKIQDNKNTLIPGEFVMVSFFYEKEKKHEDQ